MTSFLIVPLRTFYGLDASTCGAPGDNNHLYWRHRSPNWDRTSRYCTNRTYGPVDPKDHAGDQNWYRAVDIGIQGPTMWDACHRLDAAVRGGEVPEVAEWFGSYDGQTVVGWYEGHPSSSDTSHLFHMHVGFWTQYANDFEVMQRVFNIVTGQEDEMTDDDRNILWATGWLVQNLVAMQDPITVPARPETGYAGYSAPNLLAQAIKAGGGSAVDLAAVLKAAHDGAAEGIDGATLHKAP